MEPHNPANSEGIVGYICSKICKYPAITAFIIALLVVLVFILSIVAVYQSRHHSKSTMLSGNLLTGSNNPMWWHGGLDSGWGGSMHNTKQYGETRPYGVGGTGYHQEVLHPYNLAPSCNRTGMPSPGAVAEAQTHQVLQSVDAANLADTSVGQYLDHSEGMMNDTPMMLRKQAAISRMRTGGAIEPIMYGGGMA